MACEYMYRAPQERSRNDIINEERDANFEKLEQELLQGQVEIISDIFSGETRLQAVGGGVSPAMQALFDTGMADMCVLAGLQSRDTLAWQLAAGAAGVKNKDFATLHGSIPHH